MITLSCCLLHVVAQTKLLQSRNRELLSTINSEDFDNAGGDGQSGISLQVPSELVEMFGGEGSVPVRAVSFLYFNVENFFPSGLSGEENK